MVQHAITQLQGACSDAVTTLQAVMGNADAPASARVSAAKTVLDMACQAQQRRIVVVEWREAEETQGEALARAGVTLEDETQLVVGIPHYAE